MPIAPAMKPRNIRMPAPKVAAPVKTTPARVAPTGGLKRRPGVGHNGGPALNDDQQRAMQGFQQFNDSQVIVKMLRERRLARPFNFFMKPGESRKIIILDAAPYFYYWHEWPGPGGNWKQRRGEVCLKGTGQACPGCQKFGREGSWVMALTVLDLTPYTPQKGVNAGKLQRFQRKLMPVKSSTIEKYERLFKKNDMNLRGILLTVHRSTKDKSPAAGDDFDMERRISEQGLQTYGADNIKVADYKKGFEPLTPEVLQYVLGQRDDVAGDDDMAGVNGADDDEIPFVTCDLRHEPMPVWRKRKPIL